MQSTLRNALPPVYHRFLPALFDETPPAEERATCSNCAMCPPPGVEPPEGVEYFRPDSKCCTFFPTLPNYLVGAVLNDADRGLAEGQRRLRALIGNRLGVNPRWVEPTRKHRLLHKASRVLAFGRSLVLRCPYYVEDGGLCSIWRHRESVCATWFCKYDAAADGERFWQSLSKYLRTIEVALSRHALTVVAPELEVPESSDEGMTLEELEGRPPGDDAYRALWGAWAGREEELYRRCHEVVAGLRPDELGTIAGDEHARALATLADAHDQVSRPRLPERLVLGGDVLLQPAGEGAVAVGYSRYDPMYLSSALIEVLRTFAPDEPVAAARARLAADGIELPEELLLSLHRARILVQP